MNLIEGWKRKFPRLWSVRFALLSALLGAAELVLPLMQSEFPPRVFALLSFVTAIAAAVARIVAQPSLREPTT
jgi:hypothetical protein